MSSQIWLLVWTSSYFFLTLLGEIVADKFVKQYYFANVYKFDKLPIWNNVFFLLWEDIEANIFLFFETLKSEFAKTSTNGDTRVFFSRVL